MWAFVHVSKRHRIPTDDCLIAICTQPRELFVNTAWRGVFTVAFRIDVVRFSTVEMALRIEESANRIGGE